MLSDETMRIIRSVRADQKPRLKVDRTLNIKRIPIMRTTKRVITTSDGTTTRTYVTTNRRNRRHTKNGNDTIKMTMMSMMMGVR